MFHLLCTDFVKYNFVLDWHVHWYVCTAVWYVSFIIVSWYWYVTVFGFLPVSLSQILPHGLAPNIIFFVSYSNLSAEKNVVLLWYEKSLLKTCTFISLHERYVCSIQGSKHAPDILCLTDPFCPPQQMTCYKSLCLHSCLGTTSM